MSQVTFEAMRFHSQKELQAYKNDGQLKGSFTWPLGKIKTEDKAIVPMLEALAGVELKGTMVIARRKNDDGHWDYCTEREGKIKAEIGETAESKAAHAQKGDEELEPLRVIN